VRDWEDGKGTDRVIWWVGELRVVGWERESRTPNGKERMVHRVKALVAVALVLAQAAWASTFNVTVQSTASHSIPSTLCEW
jgi:hypothetical protein